ncbi:MAG TPA: hypothetical protein VEY95_13765 [Azospirillaceae bacterium]|nr:hypothetical protein [Azospirillaceae bacterium]
MRLHTLLLATPVALSLIGCATAPQVDQQVAPKPVVAQMVPGQAIEVRTDPMPAPVLVRFEKTTAANGRSAAVLTEGTFRTARAGNGLEITASLDRVEMQGRSMPLGIMARMQVDAVGNVRDADVSVVPGGWHGNNPNAAQELEPFRAQYAEIFKEMASTIRPGRYLPGDVVFSDRNREARGAGEARDIVTRINRIGRAGGVVEHSGRRAMLVDWTGDFTMQAPGRVIAGTITGWTVVDLETGVTFFSDILMKDNAGTYSRRERHRVWL